MTRGFAVPQILQFCLLTKLLRWKCASSLKINNFKGCHFYLVLDIQSPSLKYRAVLRVLCAWSLVWVACREETSDAFLTKFFVQRSDLSLTTEPSFSVLLHHHVQHQHFQGSDLLESALYGIVSCIYVLYWASYFEFWNQPWDRWLIWCIFAAA